MIHLDSVPIPNPNVVGHIVDEQAVVVVPELGNVKVFNEVGTQIWGWIDGKRVVKEIVNLVCQTFEVDVETAEQDTLEFITIMVKQDIVSMAPE